ncbi:MAG TPA: uridine diphosphate-N-acetylglucosamine-binding protein YvcK [Clostridia bacterium]|nr:uridine diphosphate-N-acetylglucosamine-binding protein YvcK [Clostridia bacterium]
MADSSTVNTDERVLKVVAIGGGTGLSAVLRGLKHYVPRPGEKPSELSISRLAAVVCVTDDGGSSGRLRKELNVPPPGDIRNCMVALAEDEALLSRLFQYRFSEGEGLEGHSFGNLFLTALARITGDFAEAVKLSSAILKSCGEIFPASTTDVQLDAEMSDGSRVRGETNITASQNRIVHLRLVPANARPLPQTLLAIAEADLITIGPGSLFTSLVPNLLVRQVSNAIAASAATKVYVCNIMTQVNESLGLTAADHMTALFEHAGRKVFDYAMLNGTPVPEDVRAKYALEGSTPVVHDLDRIRALGVECVVGDYLDNSGLARHDIAKIARDLLSLAVRGRRAASLSS